MKTNFLFAFAGLAFFGLIFEVAVAQQSGPRGLGLINDVEEGFESLFNGENLNGWVQKNGTAKYEVVNKTIMGHTKVGSPNSFLCTIKEYSDFELRFQVKVDVGLNSGVQIRSLSKPKVNGGRVHGPQVEIESGPAEAGYIYSEGTGRKWISPQQPKHDYFDNDGWNSYRVIADGNRIQTWINGHPIEDVETAEVESLKGFIGLQVHSIKKNKGPFKVQWKNLRIKELDGTERRTVKAIKGTPTVDGKIDDLWKHVPRLKTTRAVEEHDALEADEEPATAWVKCMWDNGHLYCLAKVSDSKISGTSDEPWECDSVEFFVDGNLSRGAYDEDDAQYRTGADGLITVGATNYKADYKSVVTQVEGGYIVESRINIETELGKKIGFDVQVNNDAGGGYRVSTMKWNDASNESYQNASELGVLEMVEVNK
ncbi:MAG: DUF1080 domain-containing protein [Mariniblastus sp.]|nr:DUF1080 domain-containing protein [Mariniblastus sp.]